MILNTYDYKDLMAYFKKQQELKKSTQKILLNDNNYKKKDFNYYFGNNESIMNGKFSVVGIDLTGNEKKASGWCYLSSNRTECRAIRTNNELLESVEKLQPDIVSIDSPLSYPKGRDCAKKDCTCSKFGILRENEKLLRHFGVPIYPCLIDSMVDLTTRGMYLAKILRSKGFEVIESYPGVAQDILHIPRKGKTKEQQEHLKKGLISFGLTGDLIDNPYISHDELDAITSALVGYFYANQQYVSFGNKDENYLIIPRILSDFKRESLVIGLCGETCVGKTTIAEFIKFQYGIPSCRYSKIISEVYNIFDKKELQSIGSKIAKSEKLQRDLSKEIIKKMEKHSHFVVDGLRHLEDYQELKNFYKDNFKLIYIYCNEKERYSRYNKQNGYNINREDFLEFSAHESEKDISILNFFADHTIENNGSYKKLFENIKKYLNPFL